MDNCAVHEMVLAQNGKNEARIDTLESDIIESRLDRKELHAKVDEGERMMQAIIKTQEDILKAVEGLKGKPGRMWDKAVSVAVAALISGIVGAIIAYFAKG